LLQTAGVLLAVLALGEVLPMSQWINYGIILGKSRHKVMAWISILELIATVSLAWVLSGPYGLVGVCVAVAVPGALCRGVCQAVYCCRLVDVSLREYLVRALVPPLLSAAAPALGLYSLTAWHAPNTWLQLCLYGAVFTSAYLILGALILIGPARLRLEVLRVRNRLATTRADVVAPGMKCNSHGIESHEHPAPVVQADR
jgi:hypothetical protein